MPLFWMTLLCGGIFFLSLTLAVKGKGIFSWIGLLAVSGILSFFGFSMIKKQQEHGKRLEALEDKYSGHSHESFSLEMDRLKNIGNIH